MENVNNRLQDMRDALEEIKEVEKRLNLNGEISNAVQGIIIDATNMFNKEIDKIVSEAEDIQEELRRAKEYLENNPETALASISSAYKRVTNIALTEKIREDGARYTFTPEQEEESEKSQIDQILDDLAKNLETIRAIASHAPEDKETLEEAWSLPDLKVFRATIIEYADGQRRYLLEALEQDKFNERIIDEIGHKPA